MGLFTEEKVRKWIKVKGMNNTDDISPDLSGESLLERMEAKTDTTRWYVEERTIRQWHRERALWL